MQRNDRVIRVFTQIRTSVFGQGRGAGSVSGEVEVVPPPGRLGGWETVDDFVLDLASRVRDGMPIFPRASGLDGGSDMLAVFSDPASGYENAWDAVREALHVAIGAVRLTSGGSADAARVREAADSALQARFGEPVSVVLGAGVPGAAVFRFSVVDQPTNSSRSIGLSGSGRMTGSRSGNLFLRESFGQALTIRRFIQSDEGRAELLGLLQADAGLCFRRGDRRRQTTLSPSETLCVLGNMSCVLLCLWLRFAGNALSFRLVSVACPGSGEKLRKGPPTTLSIIKMGNRLAWNMAYVLAHQRQVHPDDYWDTMLGDAISEADILALARKLHVNIYLFNTGTVDAFMEFVREGTATRGIVSRDEFDDAMDLKRDIRGLIMFKGSRVDDREYRARSGYSCILRCSFVYNIHAHADVILDPLLENAMLFRRYNRFVFDVTYDISDNPRSVDGYFDSVKVSVGKGDLMPLRIPSQLSPLDLSEVGRVCKDDVVLVASEGAYDDVRLRLVRNALRMCSVHAHSDPSELDDVAALRLYMSTNLVRDLSERRFGRVEKNAVGLVYVLGDFVRALDAADVWDRFTCRFMSTHGKQRARSLFDQVASRIKCDAGGRADPITRFDDVSYFFLSLLSPSVTVSGATVHSRSVLVEVCLYDESRMSTGKVLLATRSVRDGIHSAMAARYGEAAASTGCNEIDLAVRLSKTSVFSLLLNNHPYLVDVVNRRFGTWMPLEVERALATDAQIDEPVVPVGIDKERMPHLETFWELDLNMCYTLSLMGMLDAMLHKDFYGGTWIREVPRRPTRRPLCFDKGDFLRSYQACLGFSLVENIDFPYLMCAFPATRDRPGVFNKLNSWWRFSRGNADAVSRFVPNASIIHFTSLVVKVFEERGHMVDKTQAEMWTFVQRDILRLTESYFHHDEPVRDAILAVQSKFPGDGSAQNSMLRGMMFSYAKQDGLGRMRDGLDKLYTESVEFHKAAGMAPRDAYKAAKADFNRAVGLLKTGTYIGSISVKRVHDMLRKNGDDAAVTYTLNGDAVPFSRTMQVHVRELPGTDMALVEAASVRPVALQGHPRGLRIDALERSRHVVDILAMVSNAFRVKVDAVFFHDDALEDVLDFVSSFVGELDVDTADCMRESARMCIEENCTPGKMCGVHNPYEFKASSSSVSFGDGPSLYGMSLFKIVPWFSSNKRSAVETGFVQAMSSRNEALECAVEESCRKLSDQGRELIATGQSLVPKIRDARVSSLVLGAIEVSVDSAERGVGFASVPEPTPTDDVLKLHCDVVSGAFPFVSRPSESGAVSTFAVDTDAYCAAITESVHGIMDDMLCKGGLLLEGPPGTGKSHTVKEYIRRRVDLDSTLVFVVTATHLTLRPYLSLRDLGAKVSISTFHAFIGAFGDVHKCAADPGAWFADTKKRYSCRYVSMRRIHKGNFSKILLFVDEYEMLGIEFEEILMWFSEVPEVHTVLLGDRKQTAAYGRGIRCGGDVVRHVTRGQTLHFDLPFRNADYNFVVKQKEAALGRPTLYFQPPLCNYALQASMDAVSGQTGRNEFMRVVHQAAREWMDAGGAGRIYKDPIVSCQNYKAFVVVTLRILGECELGVSGALPFVGSSSKGSGKLDPFSDQFGSLDVSGTSNDENLASAARAASRYAREVNHIATDPVSKDFLVGTRVKYMQGFTYRSVKAFLPSLHTDAGEDGPVRQAPVPMGTTLLCMSTGKPLYLGDSPGRSSTRNVSEAQVWMFEDDLGVSVYLTRAEVQAYLYYPFCLYTEGVVGHTFDRYCLVHFTQSRTFPGGDYESIKVSVRNAEQALGANSWLCPRVKTMNVATSRLTLGNCVNMVEVSEGGKGFWKKTVYESPWHFASPRMFSHHYEDVLRGWRDITVLASKRLYWYGSINALESAMTRP